MAFYLLQEDGFKISLEDGSGFILLEDGSIARITQIPVDAAIYGDPDARITQIPVDVVLEGDPDARITQIPVDVLLVGDADARFTQIPVDVLIQTVREFVQITVIELHIKDP